MKITTKTEQARRIAKTRSWMGVCVDKQKNGEATDDRVVTVFVEKKLPKDKISWRQKVPQKIDGMRTDVLVVDGEFVAEDDVDLDSKLRPVRLGCSIMNVAGNGKGSHGPYFRDEPFADVFYGGTNSHVDLADPSKDLNEQESLVIVQPGFAWPDNAIADVVKAQKIIPHGTVPRDSAIHKFRRVEDVDPSVVGYGVPVRVRVPAVGETGRLISWKMLATGKKLFADATVQVSYPAGPTILTGVSIYERMSVGGTSGTTITSLDGTELWELNEAGSPTKTVATPIPRAFDVYGKVPVFKAWWDEYKKGEQPEGPDDIFEMLRTLLRKIWEFVKNIFKR